MMANNKQQNVETMSNKMLPDTESENSEEKEELVRRLAQDYVQNYQKQGMSLEDYARGVKVKEEPQEEDDSDDYPLFFSMV